MMITSQDVAADDVLASCLKGLDVEVRDLSNLIVFTGEIHHAKTGSWGFNIWVANPIMRSFYKERRFWGERESGRRVVTLSSESLSLRVFGENLMLKDDGVDVTVRGGSRCVETSMVREFREKQEMLHAAQAEAIEASSSP